MKGTIMKRILTILMFSGTALAQAPASTDALDALRGLKSATEVGINLRDYAPRVVDAKVKLDKYLATAPKDGQQLEPIMRLYVMALQAWTMKAGQKGTPFAISEEIMASPELSSCPAMQNLIVIVKKESEEKVGLFGPKDTPAQWLGVHLFTSQGVLWKCAAEKLASLKP